MFFFSTFTFYNHDVHDKKRDAEEEFNAKLYYVLLFLKDWNTQLCVHSVFSS